MTRHRLSGRVVWLVGRASMHAQRLMQEQLGSGELRKQHYPILASLATDGPAAQAVLADRIRFDRSDLVSLLDELEHLGLVTRQPDTIDRRRKIVAITEQGQASLETLDGLIHRADDELLAPLKPDERKTLARLLSRIVTETETDPPTDR